ncbi:MAG: hypothetical protein M5R40_25975 [Anaerolineae bacterium]|nr:hypothetical protein [Anaerolineae bacterium]
MAMLPGVHPLEELEAALLRVAVNPPASLLEQLRQDERGLLRAVKRALPLDDATELFLIVDQFEEIFTLVADEAERRHFVESLYLAATEPRGRLRVVVTLRADFLRSPAALSRSGRAGAPADRGCAAALAGGTGAGHCRARRAGPA